MRKTGVKALQSKVGNDSPSPLPYSICEKQVTRSDHTPREGLDEGGDTRRWGSWGPSYRLPTTETRGLRWVQGQWEQMSEETSKWMKGEVGG